MNAAGPARGYEVAALVVIAAAAAVAVVLRLDFGAMPEVTRFRDDAYYEFAWARSVAAGTGPCVVPGVATHGVQLGWSALLAVVAAGWGAGVLPVAAHGLGLVLHVSTAVGIGVLLRAHGAVAVAAALLYAGNPFLLSEAQNGQETALAGLAVLALWWAARRGGVSLAIVGTLAGLVRTDLLLLLPFLGIAARSGGGVARALMPAAVAGVAVALVCVLLTGRAVPDSAQPIPWLFEQHFAATDPGLAERGARLWWWLRPCALGGPWTLVSVVLAAVWTWAVSWRWVPARRRWWPAVAVALAAVAGARDLEVPAVAALFLALSPAASTASGSVASAPAREARIALALFAGAIALMLCHHVWRHYPRPYYFAPLGVPLCAALGLAAARRPPWLWPAAVAAALLAAAQARALPEQRPWQHEMKMAAQLVDRVVPAEVPIGVFNAGLAAWYRPGPVVNLDGVVNAEAFAALRAGALDDYLDRRGVRFVLDHPVQFQQTSAEAPQSHASGRWFSADFDAGRALRALARFDVPGVDAGRSATDAVVLYWRVGRGEPPAAPRPGDFALLERSADARFRYVQWCGAPGAVLSVEHDGDRRPLLRAEPGVWLFVAVPTPAAGRYIVRSDPGGPPLATFVVKAVP